MDKLFDNFQNPEIKWRGKPFWAWNGKLEKEELIRQISVMKEMGFSGFFMHSRTGLATEYLGDEWFELINACADEAEKLGMDAWLYDEDRFPSGLVGGEVSKHPEYRQKSIRISILTNPEDFVWKDDMFEVWSCDLEDTVYSNLEKVTKNTIFDSGSEKVILIFDIVEQGTSNLYNGYTYIDTMNKDATKLFLSLTHDKYIEKCGDRIGKSIPGIFTDEPHRGAILDGFAMYCDDGYMRLPYTQKLFEIFKNQFGYELEEHLPELFLFIGDHRVSQVKWHYVELLQQLFIDNFAIPCQDWCKKNNLILTGHILHEDTLTAQAAISGSVMRYYEHMDYPGVDVLTEGNINFWIVKQLQSSGRQLGKKWLLSELYGVSGWQMPFKGHKTVGDWQTLLGINFRCPHLSWYTMHGEAKRDYPGSIFHQSAWYQYYNYIETYFARFGYILSQGKPVCDVLVINPIESVWSQIHLGWSNILTSQDERIQKLELEYKDLFYWLLSSQIDFDYGDEEMISRLTQVKQESDSVHLEVGKMKYKTVVVGRMETIRSSTIKILNDFKKAGGKIIFAGAPPCYVDALKSNKTKRLADNCIKVDFKKEAVIEAIRKTIPLLVELENYKTGNSPLDIFGILRKTEDSFIYAVLNTNRDESREDIRIRIKGNGYIEEWDCLSGTKKLIQTNIKSGYHEFNTRFEPAEEKLYVLQKQTDAKPARDYTIKDRIEVKSQIAYSLEEPNICVLDLAEWQINDEKWNDELEVLKIDQSVRKKYDLPLRDGEMLQPWFVAQHKVDDKCKLKLNYYFEIETLPNSIELVFEEPKNFNIAINGHKLDTEKSSGWWIDIAFHRVKIPMKYLCKGKNTIELSTTYNEKSNIEAIYLLGVFGVKLDDTKRILNSLPKELCFKNLVEQNLPFYSGAITYHLPMPRISSTKVQLKLNGLEAACAVVGETDTEKLIAWEPYTADISTYIGKENIPVKIILTRRNTFGPLHEVPLIQVGTGPTNYITEGDAFSPKCHLYPSGLTKVPIIEVLED